MPQKQLLLELLTILTAYLNVKADFGQDYATDRQLMRGLCNQALTLDGIDPRFYQLQNELLSAERTAKGVIDVDTFTYHDNVTWWQGDITRLQADAIVNAANAEYLGCFVPCHNCIDNVIMSASGFQMRDELRQLRQSPTYATQAVKVTQGYNLPCRLVFHVAGPQVVGPVTAHDRQHLAACYRACLDEAHRRQLHNLVFCCIATGLYAFPNALACASAVDTVRQWQQTHPSNLKVVFNVFQDVDKELYAQKLSN